MAMRGATCLLVCLDGIAGHKESKIEEGGRSMCRWVRVRWCWWLHNNGDGSGRCDFGEEGS